MVRRRYPCRVAGEGLSSSAPPELLLDNCKFAARFFNRGFVIFLHLGNAEPGCAWPDKSSCKIAFTDLVGVAGFKFGDALRQFLAFGK